MKTIPLTVLVHEGPMARAYLAMLYNKGMKPKRIIRMIYTKVNGRKVAPLLPSFLKKKYAAWMQDVRNNFWPRQLLRSHPSLYYAMTDKIAEKLDFPSAIYHELLGLPDYSKYSDDVIDVMCEGFTDKKLINVLSSISPEAVLFTGGGIIPKVLFDIKGIKFLHVHPGHLPYVRGSDGLLWSTVIRGCPACSCFYMEPGLDTGDIISIRDFPALKFEVPSDVTVDDKTLYRMLYSFYDPIMRGILFAEIAEKTDDFINLETTEQNEEEGETYRFMNIAVLSASLGYIFEKNEKIDN